MAKPSRYVAKQPDENAFITYTDEEHATWSTLIQRQQDCVQKYACPEYQTALARLDLPVDHIPQCKAINDKIFAATGWTVAPVAALISFDIFFRMLSNKIFPAASFIRSKQELDYLPEPDIFHEIFGHAPLLMDQRFADFSHAIGKIGLQAQPSSYSWLARLYWFTIEFGLISQGADIRPFGAGIVSSFTELPYSVESDLPKRKPFELMDVLRTPYRIDIHQTNYFVLSDFEQLFELTNMDLLTAIEITKKKGLYQPDYPQGDAA